MGKILRALDEDSSTGPDKLPNKLLKQCSAALALPVAMLCRLILLHGVWPDLWKTHWLLPLFKKKARSDPDNYRGIHLTSQLSKAVERVLASLFLPYLTQVGAFGRNQFAYIRQRGYRDALAFAVFTWVWALGHGKRIATYCYDVSGAFDRVNAERLVAKLRAAGVHVKLVDVIASWLKERVAHTCVDGVFSDSFVLSDMVFQGTVLGPPLWNMYYADAADAIVAEEFVETVFADDLNCFRVFNGSIGDDFIFKQIQSCQSRLHEWGAANQVVFEPSKESKHILDRSTPAGDHFKLLSVVFDGKLTMHETIYQFSTETSWRLQTLFRTSRFYSTTSLVRMFKCHILSFMEGATPAIYHAAPSILKQLDDTLLQFLERSGISEETAILKHNLAPLGMRRDLAMLTLLHKVSLGIAPSPIAELFKHRCGTLDSFGFSGLFRTHSRQLHDPVTVSHPPMIQRSIFGLIKVYNRLSSYVLDANTPKQFHARFHNLAKQAAKSSSSGWQSMFHAS